ncbi:ABC transporter substrate-binding protein [Candidatus Magnetomoraceae bacterium gMMP-15]
MLINKMYRFILAAVISWIYIGAAANCGEASSCKLLVVMSYEEANPWCKEIKDGIDSVLVSNCDIKYFYMDTKKNLKGGPQKAKEAYDLYKEFQPDGVIAADDNAQFMFVVPYLKDKVKTPVMFCGVNAEPEKYNYPASNVSGILERWHIDTTIAFVKQLIPSIKTIGFIAKDSPSGKALQNQVMKESDTYVARFTAFKLPKTKEEAIIMLEELKAESDVLFMDSMEGLLDKNGNPLIMKDIISFVLKFFEKPLLGANRYHLEQGALCAIVKTGQNQGRVAAEMLLKAMQGIPVSQLPITVNKHGKRIVNVTTMKSLGIIPKRRALIGAELVKTIE